MFDSAPLSAERIPFYLSDSLRVLEKIGFKTHDVERLFKTNIECLHQFGVLDKSHNQHVMECFYEILTIEKLLNYLRPNQSLNWLAEYNQRMKCSPIDVLPCCGLAAFTVVRILLQEELREKSV